jgi:hypothetical protein
VLEEFVTDMEVQLIAVRGDGDILLSEWLPATGTERRWLAENGGLTLLTETPPTAERRLVPVALGEGGHMLLTRSSGVLLRGDTGVALAGPRISATGPARSRPGPARPITTAARSARAAAPAPGHCSPPARCWQCAADLTVQR